MQKIIILVVTLALMGCSNNKRNLSSTPVSEQQPETEQGEVWGAEQLHQARLIQGQFRDMLLESTGDAKLMKRDAHPKHHGCVVASLKLDNKALKKKHQVGLFAENNQYSAMVRFSNGDPDHLKSDKKNDVRGMAIKLFDVPYEHYLNQTGVEPANAIHDFVFMNSKEFFIKDPAHYGKFMGALKKGGLSLAAFGAVAVVNPKDDFVSIIARAFRMKVDNPLDIDYHSATPYKLGPDSMKMKFKSCKRHKTEVARKNKTDNYLSRELKGFLDQNETCFDFYVQPNRDPKKNDIENSQKKWSTKKSPFIKVGRLSIPKQSKESIEARAEGCENVSFNPWRAPIENRPLGGVNRIRLEVYIKQAKMRHAYNSVIYPGPDLR